MSSCSRRVSGGPGAAGTRPFRASSDGAAGAAGWARPVLVETTGLIPKTLPLGYYVSATHDCELLMVNNETPTALANLEWLRFLVASGRAANALDGADQIEARILSLMHLIANGLDVFGRNFNYVPLTSFDTIAALARQQLDYLVDVEANYLRLMIAARAQGSGSRRCAPLPIGCAARCRFGAGDERL